MWIAKVAAKKIAEKRQAKLAAAEETETVTMRARKKSKVKMILWGLGILGVLIGVRILVVILS